jgi:hypothetical protein
MTLHSSAHGYTIDTDWNDDGIIQSITAHPAVFGEPAEIVARDVIFTRDAHVRRALIDLGWTPPADEVET